MFKIYVKDLDAMEKFGIELGKILRSGDIVSLIGDLGTGKTTLTKSIGLGLEVEEYITSPTFALINQYDGRERVYHFDVYRLENIEELDDLGFDEYFFSGAVNLIEWGDRIEDFLPKERIDLRIEKTEDLKSRTIEVLGHGKRGKEIVKELEENESFSN